MAPRYKLSDSESESEADAPEVPSDKVLEQGLRDEVAAIFKSGNMDDLTVKRVRLAVEKKLGLEEGFFKSTDDWKSRSDQIIKDEVSVQDTGPQETETEQTEEQSRPPSPPKKKAPSKRTKSETTPQPRKRQKTRTPESEDEPETSEPSDDEAEEEEVAKPGKRSAAPAKKGAKPKPARTESPVASDEEEEAVEPAKLTEEATKDESESEMSVVLDEEPKPAQKRQKSAETSSKEKKVKKAAPKAAKGKDEDLDPDQAEIKRLQGWLVKCGIRKMWWRELQPYETPKAKIKHLKQMLEDAGMKGRYSLEKARQIREERELKADLEQIQQGAKQWGTGSAGEASDGPRRAARGRQALAFLESDGEETD